MNTYVIKENTILISTTPAGIRLYNTSKNIINDYSDKIDANINVSSKYKAVLEQLESQNLLENVDFKSIIDDVITLNRLYCFTLSFSIDFSISSRELFLATNKSEHIFYIKSIYIELYRFLERHNKDLGLIKRIGGLTNEYKEYNSCFTDFKNEFTEEIRRYRNLFFAHFDGQTQYEDYYNIVNQLDGELVARMCIRFLDVQKKLIDLYNLIMMSQLLSANSLNEDLKNERNQTREMIYSKLDTVRGKISDIQFNELKDLIDNAYLKIEQVMKESITKKS